jgi:hypothetical protein
VPQIVESLMRQPGRLEQRVQPVRYVRWFQLDGGILPWTMQRETHNQLVEGSSPSRLTDDLKRINGLSRARWRGSSLLGEQLAAESM